MNRKYPARLMIMDACVMIDYFNGEPNLFKLISSYVGSLYVATPILEEVEFIESRDELEGLGLIPIEPEIEDVFKAADMDGKTSFQDNLCYLTAKRQGMICITNDTNLRKQCSATNVPALWGLELILELVKAGGLSKKEAAFIVQEIHRSNPKHINKEVLAGFNVKLESGS